MKEMNFKFHNSIQLLLILLIIQIHENNCAKILTVFQYSSKSHMILGSALCKALAKRGHAVTVISGFPLDKPVENYRDIFVQDILSLREGVKILESASSIMERIHSSIDLVVGGQEMILSHPQVQEFMANESFDLVIHNMRWGDALLGLSHHFKAPSIGYFTSGTTSLINEYTGNTSPLSYVPSTFLACSAEMTFFQRLNNVFLEMVMMPFYNNYIGGHIRTVYKKHFPNGPELEELKRNVSLVLINSHVSLESPRPYVPNMIQIGGSHIEEPKALPKDLQDFLDEAKNGAIYFSLGTNLRLSTQPKERIQAIFSALEKSNMQVLLKSEEHFENVPSNIRVEKWLPQNDILAHPNIKLFVSHGGLLSVTEAVYHGVPILGIPVYGDQKQNVLVAKNLGFGEFLLPKELNEATFSKTLNEMTSNPKYTENIKLRSNLLRDQPIKPIDLAVFWVEHVIKYRGAVHLQNAGMKLTWYQYHLVDIFAFILLVLVMASYLCYLIIVKVIVRLIRNLSRAPSLKKIN